MLVLSEHLAGLAGVDADVAREARTIGLRDSDDDLRVSVTGSAADARNYVEVLAAPQLHRREGGVGCVRDDPGAVLLGAHGRHACRV